MNWAIELTRLYLSKNDIASIFGIIIYTDAHPHIKKLLADNDYWLALDEISGPAWAIFSIKPMQGYFELDKSNRQDMMSFMVKVWREPRENKELLDAFELSSTRDLPLFLVFTQDNDGDILKIKYKIEGENIDETFSSLRRIVKTVTNAINGVSSENIKNPLGVYQAVSLASSNYFTIDRLKKGIKLYSWVKSLVS